VCTPAAYSCTDDVCFAVDSQPAKCVHLAVDARCDFDGD